MCAPLISFDTVREIMTSWMTQYTEDWNNEGSRWNYESNTGDFEWYKYPMVTSEGLRVGASLSDEGTVITIWTGTISNHNIIISDGIIFNDHSDFDQGFKDGPIYWLYTKLKDHALSRSAKLEPIKDEIADKPIYAVYDQAGECKHALLRNATENKLEFIYYYKAGPTHISVSIDDYLNKKFKIKPLVDNEQ